MNNDTRPMLYLVVTGAPLTRRIHEAVPIARDAGWRVAVIATDAALPWLDRDQLNALDVPIVTNHREPAATKRLPGPSAVALAPGTFNTINKFATGAADTYALSTLCEALGARVPVIIVPFVNVSLAGHPAWLASLAVLRYAGATLIDPRSGTVNAHEPLDHGTGDAVTDAFDWSWMIDQLGSQD
jgi:phosphopantothenoylcysteine synthetase/decarboxylase